MDTELQMHTDEVARSLELLRQRLTRAQRDDLASEVAHLEGHLRQIEMRLNTEPEAA